MLVGNNTSAAFSENDLIRERIAQNVGNASDTEIMNVAVTNYIVVSVPADTPIYIVFTKRGSGTSSPRSSTNAAQQ
jgi:predicted nuclease of predicted toxin-antitoxin system